MIEYPSYVRATHTHTHTTDSNFGPDIPLFTKLYELYGAVSASLPLFPKTQRYTLGGRIEQTILDLLELLFSIPLATNRLPILKQMSIKTDLLKTLLRLSKDTHSLSIGRYLELQAVLQEIGKMLGGWMRATKQLEYTSTE
jgi:hypothetical protein